MNKYEPTNWQLCQQCSLVHNRIQSFIILLVWQKKWTSKLSVSKIISSIAIINGSKSKTKSISLGVPQGFMLGPLLFLNNYYSRDQHILSKRCNCCSSTVRHKI